jgi:hypothetical protein
MMKKLLVVALACAVPACSFAFGRGPAQPRSAEACPHAAATADTIIAGALLATAVGAAFIHCGAFGDQTGCGDYGGYGPAFVLLGALAASVPYDASMAYGWIKRGQCLRRVPAVATSPASAADPSSP